jgi:hypothetical protein
MHSLCTPGRWRSPSRVTISGESRPPVRITVGFATRADAERARALLVEAFGPDVVIQGALIRTRQKSSAVVASILPD